MDILQWDVNGLHTPIPELDTIRRKYAPAAVCLQESHLRLAHNAFLRGYTSYWYDHLAGDKANGSIAIFIRDSVHSCAVPLQTTIQADAPQLLMAALKFTICRVYLPPHTTCSLADLQDLLCQLPAPFILLGDFNARHHLWGSVAEDERGQVINTLIS
jgi:exonuclease III